MSKTDTTEINKLSDADITNQIEELRRELFDLRFKKATSQLTNTHLFKFSRVKLAQLLTLQNERSRSNPSS